MHPNVAKKCRRRRATASPATVVYKYSATRFIFSFRGRWRVFMRSLAATFERLLRIAREVQGGRFDIGRTPERLSALEDQCSVLRMSDSSRRSAVVVLQDATQSSAADNLAGLRRVARRRDQDLILSSLVRAFRVVVFDVLANQQIEMLLSEDDKAIKTFFLDRSVEPLDKRVHVRGSDGSPLNLASGGLHCLIERRGKHAVVVADKIGCRQIDCLGASNKRFCLSHHPLGGWIEAHGDRNTRRDATCRKTKTKHCRTPVTVTMCREKKSHCQSVSAWAFMNSAHV